MNFFFTTLRAAAFLNRNSNGLTALDTQTNVHVHRHFNNCQG